MLAMMQQRFKAFWRPAKEGDSGQAIVEFAVAFPLQMFVTFGIAQLILIYIATLTVNVAAYRACRSAVVNYWESAETPAEDAEEAATKTAAFLLAPLTTAEGSGFSVDPDTRVTIPGWGEVRNSDVARAKSQVYLLEKDGADERDMTIVIEYHYKLLFPFIDSLMSGILANPDSPPDADQYVFGWREDSPIDQRLYGVAGGPFIREINGNKYLIIIRECTMYRQTPPGAVKPETM